MVAKKVTIPDPDAEEETITDPTVAPVEDVVEEEVEEVEEDLEPTTVEELDPDQALWDGGPTAGQIVAWKAEWPDCDVYVTSATVDKHYVWRTLERDEYKLHIANMEALADSGDLSPAQANLYNEEVLTELVTLFPKYKRGTKGGGLAGVPSIISQQCMEASGFVALEVRQL